MSWMKTKSQVTRSYGKIVDTVDFKYQARIYKIEVRMKVSDGGDYKFCAICFFGKQKYNDLDFDMAIGEDAKKAVKELQHMIKERTSTDWVDMIHINVAFEDEASHNMNRAGKLGIQIGRLQVGTRYDGTKCWRHVNDFMQYEEEEEPDWRPDGRINDDAPVVGVSDGPWASDNESYGLIPYTEETWRALEVMIKSMEDMATKVKKQITGDDPEAIVSAITKGALLLSDKGQDT